MRGDFASGGYTGAQLLVLNLVQTVPLQGSLWKSMVVL